MNSGLFVLCANRWCEAFKSVPSRALQQQQWTCPTCQIRPAKGPCNVSREAARRGGQRSSMVRQARALAKFPTLTPMQIYAKGYRDGYNSGYEGRKKRTVQEVERRMRKGKKAA